MDSTEESLLEMDRSDEGRAETDPVQQQFQFSRGEGAPPGIAFRNRGDPLVIRLDAPGLRLVRVQVAFQVR